MVRTLESGQALLLLVEEMIMMKGNNVKTLSMLGPSFCALRHNQVMGFDQQAIGQANKLSSQVNQKEERGP